MWLFKHKYFADGSLSRYMDRLVANGNSKKLGVDYEETFSPVVKSDTIMTVLSLVASRHWHVHQLDVKNAFLRGTLSETVYMHQPLGFQDPRRFRCCFFLLYVDDILLTSSSTTLLQRIIASLNQEFSMTDLGSLNYFLGIFVTRSTKGMFLCQKKYASEILERACMRNCHSCKTPVDIESKLGADGTPVFDPTLYKSLAGALQYLTFTRPDLSYAVQHICLYMHDPRDSHLAALKRILRYVRVTLDYALQLYSSSTSSLVDYSDADWTLSRSSTEADFRGVANAVAETSWLRNLLRGLHSPLHSATIVYCDNVSAIYLSSNPVQHQRMKHIKIDIHFVRDQVTIG
ncbi:ribonuclease H-like domain-containing protein [Tanacetum coccineum]